LIKNDFVTLQSLPFFPQSSTIAPLWSSSISYCDPGMVSFSSRTVITIS